MSELHAGDSLPRIAVPPPGPRSRELAGRLARVESRNITFLSDTFPVFWREAVGANVLDVDGNLYIDLTGGFAVASAGHRNPVVSDAIRSALDRLPHGLGDVHPPEIKVELLERLAAIAPGRLSRTILATSGSDAVEAALKTARLATGRPGALCFTGAYHGLGYGALAVTDGARFRAPFEDQIGLPILRAPFPDRYRPDAELLDSAGPDGSGGGDAGATGWTGGPRELSEAALGAVRRRLDGPDGDRVGAVILEPIQGRGGVVVPPPGFLSGLRTVCDRRDLVLALDEVLTGFGRTGLLFACEHEGVEPDILCLGKALTGALPFSACIARPEVMDAWPASTGEAIHTTTFLGHPLGCAAALAQLDEIEEHDLPGRADRLGTRLIERLETIGAADDRVGDVRGRGLLVGVELVRDPAERTPDPELARAVVANALRRGVLLLAGGRDGNVLELHPPLTITESQLDHAISVIENALANG